MKKIVLLTTLAALAFSACATSSSSPSTQSAANSLTLDQAIADIASLFTDKLPPASTVAITGFEADTENLAAYAVEELWNRFEGAFVMADRQNLDKIRAEMNYQMSGEVSDESARAIGKQFGVQYIIYGRITRIGSEYRIAAYATDVEKALSTMRALTVRPDARLTALLSGESLETAIERAVNALARPVNARMTIGIGRISLNGSGTVTSLSEYLKGSIAYSASQLRNTFEVADDETSREYAVSPVYLTRDILVESPAQGPSSIPIQGIVEGDFSPLGADAQVTLRLISTTDNKVLGSSRFVIPAAELDKRRLSLYPSKNGAIISAAEFDAKQAAIAPYSGRNNAFGFTVRSDNLDGIYYEGEYMTLRVYAERDCYFRILQVNVNGNVQVLYPRSSKDNNFIRAGETRRIPDNTRYRITAPFGEEYLLAAAYRNRFDIGSIGAVPLSSSALSRDIMVEEEATRNEVPPLATAKFSYTTINKQSS
jgi:hypothetical protein